MSHEVNPGIAYAETAYRQTTAVLREAVVAVRPDQPDADPRDVFDPPYPVRSDAPDPGYDAPTEAKVRASIGKLGPGSTEDVLPSELGFSSDEEHDVLAPGKVGGKVEAETAVLNKNQAARDPAKRVADKTAIVVTGSIIRTLGADRDEVAATERYGLSSENTEYDGAVAAAAATIEGFEPVEPPVALPFGYEVIEDSPTSKTVTCEVTDEPTGQVQLIGRVANRPVIGFGIDGVRKVNPETEKAYFKPPDVAGVLTLVDAMLDSPDVIREAGIGGDHTTPIALIESATYKPSRQVDAARVAVTAGRPVGVSTYGTRTFAEVKGNSEPAQPDIRQVPGELNRAAEQAALLGAVLVEAQQDS